MTFGFDIVLQNSIMSLQESYLFCKMLEHFRELMYS